MGALGQFWARDTGTLTIPTSMRSASPQRVRSRGPFGGRVIRRLAGVDMNAPEPVEQAYAAPPR
jgi:hypothetical protein